MENSTLTEQDRAHLRHCVTLAREALAAGDEPFGSVLVDASGAVVHADRNRIADGDPTAHPELALVRWAIAHMSPRVRARSTVYAARSAQRGQWLDGWGVPAPPVQGLPITTVAPSVPVAGPDDRLSAEIRLLHARLHGIEGAELSEVPCPEQLRPAAPVSVRWAAGSPCWASCSSAPTCAHR